MYYFLLLELLQWSVCCLVWELINWCLWWWWT